MSHNRDLSAAAAQIGFHSSNIGIGTDVPSETITLNHANGASIGLEYAGIENGTINVNSAAMYARAGSGKHLILGGNATESLRLKSDGKAYFTGNLGLGGQTSPGADIHINSFANSGYELKLTGNAIQFNRTSSSYIDQINDTGSILFRMGSSYTEAMRITSAGKIGINDTSPSHVLDVKSKADGTYFINGQNHNGNDIFRVYESSDGDGNHGMLYLNNGSGTTLTKISTNGPSYFNGGDIGVNITNPSSKLHVNLTKSSGSTAAERTKQHAAMRLSLDRTSGNMPYQGWGPALDFYSDNYDGSTQRPNARIAGVISNYSLGDEGGELRFYTTPTDTATSESDFAHRMSITSAGYVLKTQQPAFFVYQAQGPWSLAVGDTFVFNTAELNVGSHYNTSNGRFTAPITGRYVFHFWSIYTGDANNDYVQMYKNGARIMGGDVHFTNSIGNSWDSVHYSRVIQLSGGDYVYMRSGSAHQYHGNNWGGWSGYLLG